MNDGIVVTNEYINVYGIVQDYTKHLGSSGTVIKGRKKYKQH
jgi:hypothetical protein